MDYPAYPVYRESGIEWLGKIPDHWEVKRLKYAFQLLTEKTERKDNPVGLENIEGWSGRFIETDSEFQGDGVAFEQGDILFGKLRPYLAKVHLAQFAGEAVGDFHVLRPIGEIIGIFGLYQCLNKDFITNVDSSTYGAKMPRVSWEYMANMLLVFPSLTEQRKISAFLDHKTQQIDQLISKKQTLIDKLNEQRIALITHAVTKGLNPAVTLKDSGVEWLGEVPKHWDIRKLKFAIIFQRGHDLSADNREDGDVPVVSSAGISSTHSTAIAKAPGIVTGRYGTIGKFVYVENDYWPINTTLYSVDTYSNNVRFLWYMMHNFVDIFLLNSKKSAVPGVDRNDIHPELTVVPPIEEQTQIVDHLDKETARIDRMVELNQQTIDKLKEYRTALITAAVTGKIDLRNWQQEANHANP